MAIAKTGVLVLDCTEPAPLADFYAQFLGGEARIGNTPDYIEVVAGGRVHLAIRRDPGAAPASWPRPDDSQQAHLHFLVPQDDMDEAEREAVALGARPLQTRENRGPYDARRYSDPAGHPFVLAASEGHAMGQAV
ncbi:VOC family protein [Streptomyces sp. NBC_01456]|uniref:VOC family protein n=1 Tax=unclassified Streptomyces TaxID=2593676 RepID=UPI002E31521B|nr:MULTISPECIES: VOC family protein [unclassified Streptomyces]